MALEDHQGRALIVQECWVEGGNVEGDVRVRLGQVQRLADQLPVAHEVHVGAVAYRLGGLGTRFAIPLHSIVGCEQTGPELRGAVAEKLSVSRRTIERAIQRGELPAVAVCTGTQRTSYRVSTRDLERFLAERRTVPPKRGRPPKVTEEENAAG